jgi:hypothetical protein
MDVTDREITWAIVVIAPLAAWSLWSAATGLPDPGIQILNLFR